MEAYPPLAALMVDERSGAVLHVNDAFAAVNQKVALRLWRRLGYTAEVVTNGREAAAAVADADYDAVLMDCMMPEMDGYTATAAIRRQENGGRQTPIIALTANATGGDRARCLVAGMDDYIPRPIDAESLGTVLARHLVRPVPRPGGGPA